jgi:hypothetical protein
MIKDTNPDHFKVDGANFVEYMNDPKIAGFGNWMFANGFNSGVWESTNWILVKDKLPPNADHPGTFCRRYQVITKYGVTEGWYNPDKGCWYTLVWFYLGRKTFDDIDYERGDIPGITDKIEVTH